MNRLEAAHNFRTIATYHHTCASGRQSGLRFVRSKVLWRGGRYDKWRRGQPQRECCGLGPDPREQQQPDLRGVLRLQRVLPDARSCGNVQRLGVRLLQSFILGAEWEGQRHRWVIEHGKLLPAATTPRGRPRVSTKPFGVGEYARSCRDMYRHEALEETVSFPLRPLP